MPCPFSNPSRRCSAEKDPCSWLVSCASKRFFSCDAARASIVAGSRNYVDLRLGCLLYSGEEPLSNGHGRSCVGCVSLTVESVLDDKRRGAPRKHGANVDVTYGSQLTRGRDFVSRNCPRKLNVIAEAYSLESSGGRRGGCPREHTKKVWREARKPYITMTTHTCLD